MRRRDHTGTLSPQRGADRREFNSAHKQHHDANLLAIELVPHLAHGFAEPVPRALRRIAEIAVYLTQHACAGHLDVGGERFVRYDGQGRGTRHCVAQNTYFIRRIECGVRKWKLSYFARMRCPRTPVGMYSSR
jgi:hypothetical protein